MAFERKRAHRAEVGDQCVDQSVVSRMTTADFAFQLGGTIYPSTEKMRPCASLLCTQPRSASRVASGRRRRSELGSGSPKHTVTNMSFSNRTNLSSGIVRTAVLISGGGRSLANLCERINNHELRNVSICAVIASKKSAGGIQVAEGNGLPVHVIRAKDFEKGTNEFSDAITEIVDRYSVDVVVLAGWMHFYRIPDRYQGRVINIHPSLIPAFCGKGYYGSRVHEAVLKFGAKITGCTVHFADNEYDHGPIILQKPVAVLDGDSPDDLAARVFEAEKEALPEAIQLFADSRLQIEGRHIKIREPSAA